MPSSEPRALRELLPRFLERLTRDGAPAASLQPVWAEAAGPVIARHARVLALQGDTLVLRVSSPAWAAALRQKEQALAERLRERMGETVRHLEFRGA